MIGTGVTGKGDIEPLPKRDCGTMRSLEVLNMTSEEGRKGGRWMWCGSQGPMMQGLEIQSMLGFTPQCWKVIEEFLVYV